MDYILQTKKGLRIDFPANKFGYNDIEYKKIKGKNPGLDDNTLRQYIKPFPHMVFKDGQFIVTSEETIENPWSIDMVRETKAYKDGDVWELSQEHVDAIRSNDPHASMIIPSDYNDKILEHKPQINFLKEKFKVDFKDQKKAKEECDHYLLTLQKAMKIYRIVNISLPKETKNLKTYAALLEACRVQIEGLFEENGL